MRRALLAAALLLCACPGNGDVCNSTSADIGVFCVPNPLAPGLNAGIQLVEACGNNCTEIPSCTAVFRNSQVVLNIDHDTCLSNLSALCLQPGCQNRVIPCSLPALSEGDYTLVIPGAPLQRLHVAAGGQSSCRVAQ
jgi:hypothetical protein